MLRLSIDYQSVSEVDLTHLHKYVNWHDYFKHFDVDPGNNHCKLLSHLSNQLPKDSKISDLGTFIGQSAVSLASNPDVKVTTYDIEDHIPQDLKFCYRDKSNVKSILGNCKNYFPQMIDSSIILLDISPHDGGQERQIIAELEKLEYKGLLICDDIHLWPAMDNFWNDITLKKIDITSYGHWSGTGIVIFDPKTIDVVVS